MKVKKVQKRTQKLRVCFNYGLHKILVCACLVFAKHIFKDDIIVSSDGDNMDEEVRQKK